MAKLLTLQVARGVAVNLVVFFHLFSAETLYTAGGVLPSFTVYGFAGVDLFFVLSGFIMVAVAGRGVGPLQFLWRRAVRIYPTYWLGSLVVLVILLVAPAMHHSGVRMPSSLWRSFLLVPDRTSPLLGVGWTLVHEIYFYLVFAVFLALRTPILVGLIAWGLVIVGLTAFAPNEVAGSPVLQVATNPLTAEFMMGAVVGVLWRNYYTPAALFVGGAGLAVLGLSITYAAPALSLVSISYPARSIIVNPDLGAWPVVLFGIPSALIVYALAAVEHRTRSPRPPALLVALGDWSYATYLIHVLVISAIGRALHFLLPGGGIVASLLLIATGLVSANLAGAAIHILFERPSLKLLHRLGSTVLRRPETEGVDDVRTVGFEPGPRQMP
jgi:peptidoglycan/LPS O-acetylase OafA/YrhL